MKSKEYIPSVAFSGAEKESMMTKTNSIGLILTSLPSSKRSMRSNVCVSPTSTYWTKPSSLGKFPSACKHDALLSDSLSHLFPCSFCDFLQATEQLNARWFQLTGRVQRNRPSEQNDGIRRILFSWEEALLLKLYARKTARPSECKQSIWSALFKRQK